MKVYGRNVKWRNGLLSIRTEYERKKRLLKEKNNVQNYFEVRQDDGILTELYKIYIPRPPSGTDKCVLLGVWYAFLWNGQILKTNLISNTFFKGTIWTCLSKLSGFVWFWPALHVSICFYFLPCPSNFCSNISSMINRDVHACSNAWGLASLKMHFLSAFLQCGNWVHDVNDSCRVLTSD